MNLLHAFFFGVFILILVGLGLKSPKGVVDIFTAGSKGFNSGVSTLQMR